MSGIQSPNRSADGHAGPESRSTALRRGTPSAIAVLLLLMHAVLVLDCAAQDFVTYDEVGNLTAGLSYWETGIYQLYNVNPPLPKLLSSLPVWLAEPDMSAIRLPKSPGERPEWDVGEQFARDNAPRYHGFVVRARSVGLFWSLLGALGVYRWAMLLWGQGGALVALTVWCFEPNIIAHAHLLNVDMPATATGLWAAYLFRSYLATPTWFAAGLAGAGLGLALSCKFTLLIFYPTWCALWLYFLVCRLRTGERRIRLWTSLGQMGLVFALSLFAINLGYEFAGTGKSLKEYAFVSKTLAGDQNNSSDAGAGNRFVGTVLGPIRVPLPEDMVRGMDVQWRGFEMNRQRYSKYLRGEWSQTGWWYYYLYAAAVKVPVGLWGLLACALLGRFWARPEDRVPRGELAALGLPALIVFTFVSSQQSMQTHLRYVLPAFPFVIVYVGRVGQVLAGGRWGLRLLAGALLAWAVGSYLSVHPHSLAYFNELAGGPERGHDHLEDSNIDWGQDLLRLKRWLEVHPEARPLKLAYFNHMDPRVLGIEFRLPPFGPANDTIPADPQDAMLLGPHPGYFAVSARFTRGSQVFAPDGAGGYQRGPFNALSYFQRFQPIAKAGYSIYIYHITLDEANLIRQQYGLPSLLAD